MKLRSLAHARAGDKGDVSNIAVFAYHECHYPLLCRQLTEARVLAHFADLGCSAVRRYELPGLAALNFVLHGALAGGVTRSLALDAHGKSLSSSLLELELSE